MKLFISSFLASLALFLIPKAAYAVCPACTIAVAGGLGFSRAIGIDDTVTGIWIGGLILSSGLWTADWVGKKGWKVPQKELLFVALFFLLVIPPLYWGKMVGLAGNTLWGVDKVLLGTAFGTAIFLFSVWLDTWLRKTNQDKVYIYYQKVIILVFLLSAVSYFFYAITA